MTPTLTQIRAALQNLAMKKARPDYELCCAKQVRFALENGLEHHLIAELPFFEVLPREQDEQLLPVAKVHRVSKTRLSKKREYPTKEEAQEFLAWLRQYEGSFKRIARQAGCAHSTVSLIRSGARNITLDTYNKIMKAREELEGMAV